MTPLDAIADALAAFRLTRLVVDDRVTAKFRNAMVKKYGQDGPGYLVGCYWCTGLHSAVFVVCARRFAPKAWAPLAEVLALSAVSGLIAEHS